MNLAPQQQHHPQPGRVEGLNVGEGAPRDLQFVTVNDRGGVPRLFAPLAELNINNPLQGGYAFCDLTDNGHTYHPGVDLNAGHECNADEGLSVVAMMDGVIKATFQWDGTTSGEGNHLWYQLTDPLRPGETWVHYDHLQRIDVGENEEVSAGTVIALCGRTGGWPCAHVHTELLPGPPRGGWWQWPYNWSLEDVQREYYDPMAWWRAASAKVHGSPEEVISMILSGAQTAAVQAVIWDEYWNPDLADAGIPTAWRTEWQAGRWRGAPLSGEEDVPEDTAAGLPAGKWQLFEGGAAVWLPGQEVSWNG
jgi:hypothetical protein